MLGSRGYLVMGFALGIAVAFVAGTGFGARLGAQSGHIGLYGGARPLAPYSPGVDSGETVYLSGQVGINPETGSLHEGLQAQARQALSNLESLLTEAGLTKADDNLPKRLLEEPHTEGPSAGVTVDLDAMLPVYYRERGWDEEGVPTEEKLAELGLASM